MSDDQVVTDRLLARTTETATIHAPIESVDIAHWLLNLPGCQCRAVSAGRSLSGDHCRAVGPGRRPRGGGG